MQPTVNSTVPPSIGVRSRNRALFVIIAILALAGVSVSAISLERHYATSASGFCDFSQKFNCDLVNRSEYSSIVGIPVAAIGVAGYGLLFFLSTLRRERSETSTQVFAASIAGLAFALCLTYIEAYKLQTWCILCLSSLALIAAITLVSGIVKVRAESSPE